MALRSSGGSPRREAALGGPTGEGGRMLSLRVGCDVCLVRRSFWNIAVAMVCASASVADLAITECVCDRLKMALASMQMERVHY